MTITTAIVVEGGAMRGIFSAGALDVFLENGLVDFDLAIGASAGACNLASFLSKQHKRNFRCYTNIMARPQLFSVTRALRGGHFMDLDWLWDQLAIEEPLDQEAIERNRTRLVSVATSAANGKPLYLTHRAPNIHDELKAGCALPLFYRGSIRVGEHEVVDGGLTDPIPVEEAYRRGARRLVVVRSRPADFVKRDSLFSQLLPALSAVSPAVARAMRSTARRYQEAVRFIASPPSDAEILHLAPPRPLMSSRTTQDRARLEADYELGCSVARESLSRVTRFFSQHVNDGIA
jgi:predicted patatin/cPLA2 family phospholipase